MLAVAAAVFAEHADTPHDDATAALFAALEKGQDATAAQAAARDALAAGAVARADDLTSVDLREEVVSLRKQNAALTHRLAALEAARRDLRSDCADSTSWYYDYNPAKNCEAYVSKKSKNCKKRDSFGVTAKVACPATCGECERTEA